MRLWVENGTFLVMAFGLSALQQRCLVVSVGDLYLPGVFLIIRGYGRDSSHVSQGKTVWTSVISVLEHGSRKMSVLQTTL